MVQLFYQEVTEGRLINPIARVYIEKGLWNSDFEVLFGKHYGKEEEEQEKRETERRLGKEAPGSSTDYTVPHNVMRDKERVRTWKRVFHKTGDIGQHHPKFWEDVQSVADQISRKERDGRERRATRGDTRDRTRAREDTRERTKTRGDTREDTRGRTRKRASTRAKITPRTPS